MRNYSIAGLAGKRGQWPAPEDTSLSYLILCYLILCMSFLANIIVTANDFPCASLHLFRQVSVLAFFKCR